jgi:rubrerythrin
LSWTVIDDDGVIQVRASIDVKTQRHEMEQLIENLNRRAAGPGICLSCGKPMSNYATDECPSCKPVVFPPLPSPQEIPHG